MICRNNNLNKKFRDYLVDKRTLERINRKLPNIYEDLVGTSKEKDFYLTKEAIDYWMFVVSLNLMFTSKCKEL